MIEPFHMILLISVFFGCMLAIAHYGHIKTGRGAEEYYIAGRRVGGLVSALTYSATTYSAFMMVGLVGFVYAGGVAALGFELTYLIGTALLLLIFAPRFLLAGRKWGYLTPTELLRDRYQSTLIGVIATLMCLIFLIPYISIQAQGAGYLMNTLTGGGIPYEAGLMFILVVIAFCAWWGGLRGVAWSDAAQAFVMMLTSVVLLFFVVYSFLGGWGNFFSTLEGSYPELLTTPGPGGFFNFSKFIGLTIPWFFFALSNPQVAQRLFISKSIGAAKNMIRGFLVFGFIYTVICVLLGLMTRMLYLDLAKPDLAMPTLLAEVPTVLALVVMLGILAAAVTTADSIILSLSSMVGRDIYRVSRRKTTEKGELILGRIVIVALAAIVAFFAWRPLGMIVELAVASSAGLLVLVPSFIGAFFWRRASAAGSISSIIVGGIVVGTLYFSKIYPLGQWPGVWGIIFSTAIFISVSLLTKPPPKADEFLSHLREELGKRGIP